MVVAKGPGLKLGFLVPTVNFSVPCFSTFDEGYEKHFLLCHGQFFC